MLWLISLAAVVWGAFLVLGTRGVQFEQYLLLGFFGLASALFIFSQVRENHIGVFYLPVFLTLLMLVRFGVAPLACFLDEKNLSPDFGGQYGYLLQALEYIIIGMLAFWAGCLLAARHGSAGRLEPIERIGTNARAGYTTLTWTLVIYAGVFAIKLYLLHAHLYDYVGAWKDYYANLSLLQVLGTAARLGGAGVLAFITIERCYHSSDAPCRLLFWLILASEVAWGLASGMKAHALQPLTIVAIISSLVERRLKKRWVAAVLLAMVAVYPFSNNYRRLVREKGGLSSPGEVIAAGRQALFSTQASASGASGWARSGWQMSVKRLDMLTSVGLVLWLGRRARLLRGDERWWMLPYYPFIPRFMWPSKPVLDKGLRFSAATGSVATSSLAITYPGDLYALYGLPGIVLGMLLLGVVCQALTNTITIGFDKRRLFVYAAMFISVSHLEADAFGYLTSLLKTFALLSVAALVIYGLPRRAAKAPAAQESNERCRS
ncbi:MAG TPA: hypothetical protein VFL79_20430 [Terriglobia bacterium]|nr:hypothetical protein [Terriglobia bacterium]